MPGTIWGNSLKRRFLTKGDIKFHIDKAIKNNNIERLRYYFGLLKEDSKNGKYNGKTFLNIACINGKLESFNFLLSNGVTIDNDTLNFAIDGRNVEIINELIKQGVDINAKDSNNLTPLMKVITKYNNLNKLEIFNKLIENNVNVNIVLTKTINPGVNQHIGYNAGTSPLMMAVTQDFQDVSQIIQTLVDKGANIDWINSEGKTALMYAAQYNHLEIVELLIEANANVDLVDNENNTAYSLARTRAIQKLISKGKVALWTGWTQGDLQRFDSIFNVLEQKANGSFVGNTAEDISYCPICLRVLERPRKQNGEPGGCMYMTHDCIASPGYYHERLYDLYKPLGQIISWCTICNRICANHEHYDLVSSDELNPRLINIQKSPIADTCKPRSGGLEEKIIRLNAIREKAYELNSLKGTITQYDAMDQLIEAGWNAPINNRLPANFSVQILRKKAWNRPSTNYPPNAPPKATAVTLAPDVPVPEERKMPTTKQGENALSMDEGEVIVFYHPVDGSGQSFHEEVNPDSLVSRESLEEYVTTRIKRARNAEYPLGTCWDTACRAIMYPAEIKEFVKPELYEQYRLKFNELMAEKHPQRQSGGNNNLILPLTDAKCSIPPRVKRNIGGTRRKRKNRKTTKHRRK